MCGCAGDTPPFEDPVAADAATQSPDGRPAGCTVENSKTYYSDFDKDGYGSPNLTAVDCNQPEGFVEDSQDCDDADSRTNPEGTELCDGIDNDCNAATVETCNNACTVHLRDGDTYLFCGQALTFPNARTACEAEGMHLIRINDQAEQDWMSAQRNVAFSGLPRIWMGGNDIAANNTWVWHDEASFWQGLSNGGAVGGLYTRWRGGEPNNGDGIEDCGTVDDNLGGAWDDRPCNQVHRFVCERDAESL